MNPYQTIIFDMDGTILDTLEDLTNSTNYALTKMGYPCRTSAEIRTFLGKGMANLVSNALPKDAKQEDFDRCFSYFKENYHAEGHPYTAPYAGIVPLLQTLKSKGYLLGVVSNKLNDPVNQLSQKHFPNIFDVSIGELPHLARKPAPDLVHLCMEKLGTDPKRSIYIGDSEVDLETAKNAGLPCIAVSWGFRDSDFLREQGAERIVNAPEELLSLF